MSEEKPYVLVLQPVEKEDILKIDRDKLLKYLLLKGWSCKYEGNGPEDERGQYACWPDPYADNFRIVPCVAIPIRNHWADYLRRMTEVVAAMCQAEGRPAADILRDVHDTR